MRVNTPIYSEYFVMDTVLIDVVSAFDILYQSFCKEIYFLKL